MKKQIALHIKEMIPIQILAVNVVLDLTRERAFLIAFHHGDNVGLSETTARSSPLSEKLQATGKVIAETRAIYLVEYFNRYTLVFYLSFYFLFILTNVKTISFQLHFEMLTDQCFISVIPAEGPDAVFAFFFFKRGNEWGKEI